MQRYFVSFSLALWLLALATMILGPYVRAEDAGLACPDWPLCFGHVIPPYEYRVYLEFIHRVVAFIMSLVFLFWLFMVIYSKDLRKQYGKLALLAMFVLALQIGLGGATVTEHLNAYIVKFHLMNALIFLGILLWIWRHAWLKKNTLHKPGMKYQVAFQALLVSLIFAQIYLGGRVSTNYAGLSCTGFPECYSVFEKDEWQKVYIPPMKGHWEKHMTHRFGAYGLFLFSVYLLIRSRGSFLQKKNGLVVILLLWQMAIGVINVLYNLPVIAQVLHSVSAMIIFIIAMQNLIDAKYNHAENHLPAS